MNKNTARQNWFSDTAILIYLALFKFLVQFGANATGGYGYFRDEFYYIACSKHLAFGYVDQPPLSIVILAINRWFFGDSISSLRFLPALAGALMVFVSGLMARELGGKRWAQFLAGLSVLIAPVFLAVDGFFSMNAFDQLFWVLGSYIILLILKRGNTKLWYLFGVLAGLGLQNKISMLFFGFSLLVALLLARERRQLLTPWPWLAAFIAFLIFLPHILWQIKYDWPTLEFIHNATIYKNVSSPLGFVVGSVLEMHPFTFPIWLTGLYFFIFSRSGEKYRVFGWIYLALLVLFLLKNGKSYYLAPAYPVLFAGGSIITEQWIRIRDWNWLKTTIATILIVGGVVTAPFGLPVLSVENFIRYSRFIGIAPPQSERHEKTILPQIYSDRFGWEEMVKAVAKVYRDLAEQEQSKCAIYTQNYGEAGAVDFFGKKYGLPNAASGHNNYWLWGPGKDSIDVVIIIGGHAEDHQKGFEEVKQVAVHTHSYSMPFESNLPIFLCRKLKVPIKEIWPLTRHYI